MEVRWSPAAADDLEKIVNYVRQENPAAAQRIGRSIHEAAGSLTRFPNRGRPGRVEGTRELILPSLPFIVVYRVSEHAVEIADVLHGAQRWPPEA
jgi:addiction module RelE/StbE family toxin